MKTAEEIALEFYPDVSFEEDIECEDVYRKNEIRLIQRVAFEKGYGKGQRNPEFMKLDFENGVAWTSAGEYSIFEFNGAWIITYSNECRICDYYENYSFATREEAEAIAQFDFEKRIMECIETE